MHRQLAGVMVLAIVGLLGGWCAGAEDFIPARQDRPPSRPHSPREAVARMTVPGGVSCGAGRQRAGHRQPDRDHVKYVRRSKLPMMPEGIENLLSRRDLSDLFAFLSLDKPPSDPSARPIPGAPPIENWRRGAIASK